MLRRALTAASATALLLGPVVYGGIPASASGPSGTSYLWLGMSGGGGDGHAWTNPQNWEPLGVPGNGDSVTIDARPGVACTARVDDLPSSGVRLQKLTLSADPACRVGIKGGSVSVASALIWSAGTVDSVLKLLPNATGSVGTGSAERVLELDRSLDVQGSLVVAGAVRVAPNLVVSVAAGGRLSLEPGASLRAQACCTHPDVLELGLGGTLAMPRDAHQLGAATISGFLVRDARGTTDVAPGSTLRLVNGPRGLISDATFQGGGRVVLANPTNSENLSTFTDGSRLVLAPGGTIEGTSGYAGDGFFTWRGGHLSGLDLGFQLSGFTVAGATRKVIDEDQGFPSNVEVFSNTTFAAGRRDHHNLLDTIGGSFEVFFSTITMRDGVEVTGDGTLTSSQGNYVIDPGAGGAVTIDEDVFLSVPQELDVVSGTLVSKGTYSQGLTGSATVVEKGALLKTPVTAHPLVIEQGFLTGQGVVDGNVVVGTGGTFEPYNSGSAVPLRITGSYTQQSDASLLLDLAANGRPLRIGGVADIQGTVTYDNQPGYLPPTGAQRNVLVAGEGLTWSPGCEQTQDEEDGHWISEQVGNRVVATFSAGTGDAC
jgi:hypothetical protein